MSSLTTPESEAPPARDLSSVGSWYSVHREAGILHDDDAIVVVGARSEAIAPLAAAALTSVQFGLYSTEATPRFDSVHLIVPPGASSDSTRRKTLQRISDLMTKDGAHELMVKLVPVMIKTLSMISVGAEDLIHTIRSLPGRSAILLIEADLYRASELLGQAGPGSGRPIQETTQEHLQWLLKNLSVACRGDQKSAFVFFRSSWVADLDIEDVAGQTILLLEESRITDEHPSEEQLEEYRAAFLSGGWPAIASLGELDKGKEVDVALSLSNCFFREGSHLLAWSAWEPVLGYADQLNSTARLSIAGMAYSASDFEASRKLLRSAFESGLEAIEELSSAATLAYQLREDPIFDTLLEEMSRVAPDIAATSKLRFLRLFRARNFAEALTLANECAFKLEAAQCRAFLCPRISSEEFLRGMKAIGEEDQGLVSCAEEALFRQFGVKAITWARKVPESSLFFEKACIARVRALRVVFRKGAVRFGAAELEALLAIVSRIPQGVVRSELERLLEDGMEEPLATTILANLLLDLIVRKSAYDQESIEEDRRLGKAYDFSKGAKTPEEAEEFLLRLGGNIEGETTLIGTGKLPDDLVPIVGQ